MLGGSGLDDFVFYWYINAKYMLSICRLSTPDEVSAHAERIRSTPDESHMLCIFPPRMNNVPASSVLVGGRERGGIQVEC